MMPWHYMAHLQLSLKDLKGALYVVCCVNAASESVCELDSRVCWLYSFYKYSDDRAPIAASRDDLEPDERVVTNHSFIALDVACSHAEDQEILRPFYDPQGSGTVRLAAVVLDRSDTDVQRMIPWV